jgi:hypothetical protein
VGTAIATVLSELFIAIFEFYYVSKYVNISKMFLGVTKVILSSIVMFIVVKVISVNIPTNLATIFLEISVGIVCYLFVLCILKFDLLIDVIRAIIKKIM